MGDYYDDDEGVYRVRYRPSSPVRYVEPRASYLAPPERRPRSRERFRRSHSPSPAPLVINNGVYNEISDDEDSPVHLAIAAHRRGHSRSRAGPLMTREEMEFEQTMNELRELRLEAKKKRDAEEEVEKKQYEEARRHMDEFHELKKDAKRREEAKAEKEMRDMMELKQEAKKRQEEKEKQERRELMEFKEESKKRQQDKEQKDRKEVDDLIAFRKEAKKKQDAEEAKERETLKEAKRQLDEIKKKEAQRAEEDRLRRELEFKRLKQAEMEAAAKEEREKEIKSALEQYRIREMERISRMEREKEESDKEFERRMQKQLIDAGLPENYIAAVLKGERPMNEIALIQAPPTPTRPMFTRVARRHVSFETLRSFSLDYDMDPADPDFILIKRWVPEEEQELLWRHTRSIREKRRVLMVEDKRHRHHHDSDFEWVRRSGSSRRHRSRSPGLLMYLAGAR